MHTHTHAVTPAAATTPACGGVRAQSVDEPRRQLESRSEHAGKSGRGSHPHSAPSLPAFHLVPFAGLQLYCKLVSLKSSLVLGVIQKFCLPHETPDGSFTFAHHHLVVQVTKEWMSAVKSKLMQVPTILIYQENPHFLECSLFLLWKLPF